MKSLLIVLSILFLSCSVRVTQPERWVAYEETLINERYAVDPREYIAITIPIELATNIRNVSLSGQFEAGAEIDVYLLDSYNFSKFEVNKPFSYVYYSGTTDLGDFQIDIGFSDDYILVLDNSFSTYVGKYVDVVLYKDYEELQ